MSNLDALEFANLLNVSDAAILIFKSQRLNHINLVASKLFEISQARAIGRSPIEILRNHILETLLETRHQQEIELFGQTMLAKGVWLSEHNRALFIWDVSQKNRRENEITATMAILSHEFRTPVAAIKSSLEVLATEPEPADRQQFIAMAQQETERLVRLVEDLTVGMRPEIKRHFVIGEVFERALRLAQTELKNRQLNVHTEGEDLIAFCDADKLVQVILNLIENAARHGPNPGIIWLAAKKVHSELVVTVRDQGQELTNYENLFVAKKRNQQSDANGMGMGLYIVSTIVRAWGGRAWGEYSNGNIFAISIPSTEKNREKEQRSLHARNI